MPVEGRSTMQCSFEQPSWEEQSQGGSMFGWPLRKLPRHDCAPPRHPHCGKRSAKSRATHESEAGLQSLGQHVKRRGGPHGA